jgi:ParB-like chromosome segregation protein Spo0J
MPRKPKVQDQQEPQDESPKGAEQQDIPGVFNEDIRAEDFEINDVLVGDLPLPDRKAGLSLVKSVEKFGVWHPIIAVWDSFSRQKIVSVVDGQRRVDAAMRTETERIPAMVVQPHQVDAARMAALQIHFTRRPSPAVEYIQVLKLNEALSREQIARKLRIPTTKVDQYLRLTLLPESLNKAFCVEKLGWALVQRVVKLPISVQKTLAEHFEKEGKLTNEDVRLATQVKQSQAASEMAPNLFDGPNLDLVQIETSEAEKAARWIDALIQTLPGTGLEDGLALELGFNYQAFLNLLRGIR